MLVPALCLLALMSPLLHGGDYSLGKYDPDNAYDAPIPGWVGPAGEGGVPLPDEYGNPTVNIGNYVNPVFVGWAYYYDEEGIIYPGVAYEPSVEGYYPLWSEPVMAEGPLFPYINDVCSLGGYAPGQDTAEVEPGYITLYFRKPVRDVPGADLVVFENAIFSQSELGEDGGDPGEGIGGVFAELAYVEVSSDGVHFARFPSVSLTETAYGPNGSLDPTNVYNLAGKHVNNQGECWGTPFDLATLRAEDLTYEDDEGIEREVDINNIRYIRIVDIPGDGSRLDSQGNRIYDPYPTNIYNEGTGGFDLDAIGVIGQERGFYDWSGTTAMNPLDDDDGDGVVNLLEYAFDMNPAAPDLGNLPRMQLVDGKPRLSFRRDVRNSDITYVLEATDSLSPVAWYEVARVEAFSDPVVSLPGLEATTSAESRHTQATLGVWQTVSFTDLSADTTRFYRVRIDWVDAQ